MILASIEAVVVLPLVALISVEPRSSREPSLSIASGSSRSSIRPGRVVPPPLPDARLEPPDHPGEPGLGPDHESVSGTITERADGRILTLAGSVVSGSPSA